MQRASASLTARASPSRIAWSSALRFSGLEIVSRTTPSAGSSTRSLPGKSAGSVQHDEGVALADGLALLAGDLIDRPGVLGFDGHLHLHGLEDHDCIAFLDGVTHRAFDLPHGSGDERFDVWNPRNGTISTAGYIFAQA